MDASRPPALAHHDLTRKITQRTPADGLIYPVGQPFPHAGTLLGCRLSRGVKQPNE